MKNSIRIEELAMLILSIGALYQNNADWWWYLILLVGPDISMLGYVAGNKIGAISYNFFHHRAVAITVFLASLWINNQVMLYTGIILFGHIAMDRMLGYGLKMKQGFKFTHLGKIGSK